MALTTSWLIAYYKGDESSGNATDSVWGFTLTANNGATFATWKLNNGMSLDGTNDYFSTSSDLWLNGTSQNYSFTMWIKPTATITTQQVFINHNQAEFDLYEYVEWFSGNLRHVRVRQWAAADVLSVAQTFTAWTWYFLAGTYDGSTMTISVNAGSRTTRSSTGNGTSGWVDWFTLGSQIGWWWAYFNWIIDEVAVYNRALTTGEESDNYGGGTPPPYGWATIFIPKIIIC